MKTFTDIEQSKRLADILPKESADMVWTYDFTVSDINGLNVISSNFKIEENDIPCWSLSALLDIISIEHNLHGYLTENGMVYRIETLYAGNSESYDNPVDACYEMIVKLHEQNY